MKKTYPTPFLPRTAIMVFRWLAVAVSVLMLSAASAGTYKHITIDGSFADWAGVPVAAVDDEGDTALGFDLKAIYVANDENYLYCMVQIYPSSTNAVYSNFHHHFFIDSDNDPSTGFGGNELCAEDTWGFSQRYNDGWSDGDVTGLDSARAPSGQLPTFQYEYRLSRAVRDKQPADVPAGSGNPARDLPVFTQDTIGIGWDVLTAGWKAADAGPKFTYDMAPKPPAFTGTRNLVELTSTSWQVNDAGMDLAADWLAADYDDSQTGWKGGLGLFGFNAPAGVYPTPVVTTLTSGQKTYYLRSHFSWDSDQNGAGLLVSNYLSAGAVFYLNGTEVNRVRMPEGAVIYATPATGGPAQPGTAELFNLPADALVVGDNLLQVEVHPAAGATTSLVFGLSLFASDNLPPRVIDPLLPADRTVAEGDATTFNPGAVAGTGPFTYQWLKGGVAIPGATTATFTLDPVIETDAGSYSVQIANPKGAKATSRAAVLTPTAVLVALTDPNLPADQVVPEGGSATFTVAATGSLRAYQWYKGTEALTNEVGPQLTVNNVALADSGTLYSVTVTNRLNSVTSRKATLTVVADSVPPGVTGIVGGGRNIVVEFTEPLDPTTAQQVQNYHLDGGVQVQGAVLDPVSATTVRLTTTQQAFGQIYKLSAAGVKDRYGNAANASGPFQSTILIDGSFEDWSSIPVALTQDQLNPGTAEFKELYITNDNDYLYLRMSFYEPVGPLWDWDTIVNMWQVAFDVDNDPATGFWNGAEAVDEVNHVFRLGTSWADGDYQGVDTAIAPAYAAGTNFELRVSLRAKHELDHSLLFPNSTNGTIGVFCCIRNSAWSELDVTSPSAVYTFGTLPSMPPTIMVKLVGNKLELTWPGGGVLESRTNLTTGAWQAVTGAASGVQVQTTGPASYYRVRQ